jgi:hypothetical protein
MVLIVHRYFVCCLLHVLRMITVHVLCMCCVLCMVLRVCCVLTALCADVCAVCVNDGTVIAVL